MTVSAPGHNSVAASQKNKKTMSRVTRNKEVKEKNLMMVKEEEIVGNLKKSIS